MNGFVESLVLQFTGFFFQAGMIFVFGSRSACFWDPVWVGVEGYSYSKRLG